MKHIVFNRLYPCGGCEVIEAVKEEGSKVRVLEISDAHTLDLYMGKKVSIGDVVWLNDFEVRSKVSFNSFFAFLENTEIEKFSIEEIKSVETLYPAQLCKLTDVEKGARAALLRDEWVKLIRSAIDSFNDDGYPSIGTEEAKRRVAAAVERYRAGR
ncbi:MAG: hypothetical protein A3F91_09125 [Flavobacteria bacterium RIFCSPLOWO2_12_FULL_35_11]|nr:MAG: hypothetical protein A3F91_09125 [Flavobacteria bacterium RIFCSPLOWO2_12_FULL_35_11]